MSIIIIIIIALDLYWPHDRYHHCWYGPSLTSFQSSPQLSWTFSDLLVVMTTVAMGHNWHHFRHQHCCYAPLLTSYLLSPLLLWAISDTITAMTTVAMDHYYHHIYYDHCCSGPLLTPYRPWTLLVWTIADTMPLLWTTTDIMSAITTVAMDHHWHHIYNHHWCYGPLLTPSPSSALLLWTTANTMSVVTVRAPVSGVWRTEGLIQRRRRGAVFKQNPARLLQSWSPGHRTAQQPRGAHSSRTEQFAVVGLQSCQLPTDSFSVSRSVNFVMFFFSFLFLRHRIIETA